ncbi:MAG TPA: hypothetical protein VER04_09670 [Polyangiaceae bacterium]|nr:hypothetical protein [Polyangiaceae bacterium]
MPRAPRLLLCLLAFAAFAPGSPRVARAEAEESGLSAGSGPRVKLDQLSLPPDLIGAKGFESHLRSTLRREARRADWGAGATSKISYRFVVERLELREDNGVLHVTCTARGRLPKGKSAKSHIVFGGDPHERTKVVQHVLDIVARGVVTRLAELERARRTP